MKFGYMPDTHAGPYDMPVPSAQECRTFAEHLIDEAIAAEQSGFDGAFVPERHARTETLWPSPLMALMAMAARTTRISLGTCVLQPGLYNPVHLAEDAAAIDCLSGGRLILGIGAGYNEHYFRHFGEPFEARFGRMLESVDILRRAWTGERFDHIGTHYRLDGTLVTPRPMQAGGPPLWFAGTTEAAARKAGRHGDGLVLLGFYDPLEERRRLVDLYRAEAAASGRPAVVVQLLDGFVAATAREAREIFGDLWVGEIRYYLEHGMIGLNEIIPSIGEATYERLEPFMVVGDPAATTTKLLHFQDALGLGDDDWIILRSRLPEGPTRSQSLDSIRLFGSDVLPGVRETGRSRR
jgi:alkanesulfonate monooxygenase SsuD/methylene tetrahydromethanopterin reductase-like flavin-dependent oxidoreductase (luciferase family)